ncbi:LacI family DNA-binding transcriptional regulator [Ligilactobacillus equi]
MVTIKKIAEVSGYSTATVSRLLKGDETLSVTQSTRSKILKVASELGYGRSRSILEVTRNVALLFKLNFDEELHDVYFTTLKSRLLRNAMDRNVELTLYTNVDKLIRDANKFEAFIGIGDIALEEARRLKKSIENGVFLDTNNYPNLFDSVQPDLNETIHSAVNECIKKNYRRVGFIGGQGLRNDEYHQYRDIRTTAFQNWASQINIYDENLILAEGKFISQNGYHLGKKFLKKCANNLPEALIIASDALAVGVLQAFNEEGIIVPRDLEIISINNIDIASYTSPPLTTFAINQEDMCLVAINVLLCRISNPKMSLMHIRVNTKLIERKSFSVIKEN